MILAHTHDNAKSATAFRRSGQKLTESQKVRRVCGRTFFAIVCMRHQDSSSSWEGKFWGLRSGSRIAMSEICRTKSPESV